MVINRVKSLICNMTLDIGYQIVPLSISAGSCKTQHLHQRRSYIFLVHHQEHLPNVPCEAFFHMDSSFERLANF